MRSAVSLRERLEALGPTCVATYLRSRSWQAASTSDQASVWVRAEAEVLLPLRRDLRDYALRMGELLAVLEAVEDRSRWDVLDDIVAASADVVRLRLMGPDLRGGQLPLSRSPDVFDRTRELMTAAACSAVTPRAFHGSKRPSVATDWVGELLLGPVQEGSFALKITSSVPPALGGQGTLLLDDEPLGRRAVAVLMRGVESARQAAATAAETGEARAFEAAVGRGVSANLCDALGAIVDASRAQALELAVQWAANRFAPPGIPERVVVTADAAPVLREAGRVLRARAPTDDFELEGIVITLHRPEGAPTGTVTIAGLVQGQVRRVRVELGGAEYASAADAHVSGRPVRCLGTLAKEGRGFVLRSPHGFEAEVVDPDPGTGPVPA